MDPAREEAARHAATEFARALAAFLQQRLGERMLGIYLLGSLAHGGFSSRYSDIDVGLTLEQALAPGDDAALRQEAQRLAPDLAPKLSLFWSDRGFTVGRFPPLDRVDYLDHAVPLAERERVNPQRPSRDDIRLYLRGAPFAAWGEQCRKFAAAAAALQPADRKPFIRAFLYPARLLYSWGTGTMGSNDAAVATPPPGLDLDLVARALRCRQDAADPDFLFPERARLLRLHAACAGVLA
jgi:predicted nucleotidyltransferase